MAVLSVLSFDIQLVMICHDVKAMPYINNWGVCNRVYRIPLLNANINNIKGISSSSRALDERSSLFYFYPPAQQVELAWNKLSWNLPMPRGGNSGKYHQVWTNLFMHSAVFLLYFMWLVFFMVFHFVHFSASGIVLVCSCPSQAFLQWFLWIFMIFGRRQHRGTQPAQPHLKRRGRSASEPTPRWKSVTPGDPSGGGLVNHQNPTEIRPEIG